ncbi:MAG: hypothetical protein HUU16_00660 [Candidatus Omnitrophica bacterium]|nr:hypothetical protein [bacterium]NUN94660.1 hypothetical protein [Candidatus Omnitrophota bacterium]
MNATVVVLRVQARVLTWPLVVLVVCLVASSLPKSDFSGLIATASAFLLTIGAALCGPLLFGHEHFEGSHDFLKTRPIPGNLVFLLKAVTVLFYCTVSAPIVDRGLEDMHSWWPGVVYERLTPITWAWLTSLALTCAGATLLLRDMIRGALYGPPTFILICVCVYATWRLFSGAGSRSADNQYILTGNDPFFEDILRLGTVVLSPLLFLAVLIGIHQSLRYQTIRVPLLSFSLFMLFSLYGALCTYTLHSEGLISVVRLAGNVVAVDIESDRVFTVEEGNLWSFNASNPSKGRTGYLSVSHQIHPGVTWIQGGRELVSMDKWTDEGFAVDKYTLPTEGVPSSSETCTVLPMGVSQPDSRQWYFHSFTPLDGNRLQLDYEGPISEKSRARWLTIVDFAECRILKETAIPESSNTWIVRGDRKYLQSHDGIHVKDVWDSSRTEPPAILPRMLPWVLEGDLLVGFSNAQVLEEGLAETKIVLCDSRDPRNPSVMELVPPWRAFALFDLTRTTLEALGLEASRQAKTSYPFRCLVIGDGILCFVAWGRLLAWDVSDISEPRFLGIAPADGVYLGSVKPGYPGDSNFPTAPIRREDGALGYFTYDGVFWLEFPALTKIHAPTTQPSRDRTEAGEVES